MSEDLIGWETLKRIDLRKNLDLMLSILEEQEDDSKKFKMELEKMEDSHLKLLIITSQKTSTHIMTLARNQIIYINAMVEGLREIESRLDKIEGHR